MSMAGYETKQERIEAFQRPLNLAMNLSWFVGVFGVVFVIYGFDGISDRVLAGVLSMALLVTFGLLLWQGRRIDLAMKSDQ